MGRKTLGLALLPVLAAAIGCGPRKHVETNVTVIVPQALTAAFSDGAPGLVTLEMWTMNATRPTREATLTLDCAPSSTDLRLQYHHRADLQDVGCPGPATALAQLIVLPPDAAPSCRGGVSSPQQIAAGTLRASGQATVFGEIEMGKFCDSWGEPDYVANAEITLTPR